jgi:hypothetical protein
VARAGVFFSRRGPGERVAAALGTSEQFKWQISNGFPFAICYLNFEFLFRVPC